MRLGHHVELDSERITGYKAKTSILPAIRKLPDYFRIADHTEHNALEARMLGRHGHVDFNDKSSAFASASPLATMGDGIDMHHVRRSFLHVSHGQRNCRSDLIGLPGREQQIPLAQHRASLWLASSVMFEVGAALAVFPLLKIGSDSDPLPRYIARGVTAALSSLAMTVLLGTLIIQVLR